MQIPCYPDFVPLTLGLKDEMHPRLSQTPDGVSEYTFGDLFLFRKRYNYRVSQIPDKTFILSGEREGKKFFMTPCAVPDRDILEELFKTHEYWKGIPDSVLIPSREHLEEWGIEIAEDRDNFDYLYLRSDLAELPGKKYHKKRNLVNQFVNYYSHEQQPLSAEIIPQALWVLDRWRKDKGADGDYIAARESLELFNELEMTGAMYYINGEPAGWCLGESLADGRMFTIHFEKALDDYKGIFQYINQSFAASLPESFIHINREQDLGDEGLRQAKMTYRPSGFVKKYTAIQGRTLF
ncbi:DUF2156 domain-containing protein [Treponema primitia]|uniref:DUF2156 domain-containing protein n=1 Tax=Treponema primitia TaxID=88058 RepID=UPI0002DAB491|nr:phosphatidylglycerol lysyltransferase domain-containing protein [Treponema primitia]